MYLQASVCKGFLIFTENDSHSRCIMYRLWWLFFFGDMNCAPDKSNVIKISCDTYNLKNLITSPTCHKGQHSTVIDVVLVSNPKKYAGVLNCECAVSDFHNFVGAATMRFAPFYHPRVIYYRNYKHFHDDIFVEHDIPCCWNFWWCRWYVMVHQ